MYSDPSFDDLLSKAERTVDTDERVAMLEELNQMILDEVLGLPFAAPAGIVLWWPWIENYWGEKRYWFHNPPYDLVWFNQELKKEMGY